MELLLKKGLPIAGAVLGVAIIAAIVLGEVNPAAVEQGWQLMTRFIGVSFAVLALVEIVMAVLAKPEPSRAMVTWLVVLLGGVLLASQNWGAAIALGGIAVAWLFKGTCDASGDGDG